METLLTVTAERFVEALARLMRVQAARLPDGGYGFELGLRATPSQLVHSEIALARRGCARVARDRTGRIRLEVVARGAGCVVRAASVVDLHGVLVPLQEEQRDLLDRVARRIADDADVRVA